MRTSSLILCSMLAVASAPAVAQPQPQGSTTLTYVQPLSPEAIRLVQQHLHQQNLYSGRVDGVWGADSQAALQRFQQTKGLQVTGQLNQATIATLGIAPDQLVSAGQPPTPAAAASPLSGNTLSQSAVRAIQERLHALNFYDGRLDGIWGGETQQAIERFQQGRALQPNGQLNPATVAALGLDPGVLVPSR